MLTRIKYGFHDPVVITTGLSTLIMLAIALYGTIPSVYQTLSKADLACLWNIWLFTPAIATLSLCAAYTMGGHEMENRAVSSLDPKTAYEVSKS